MTPSVGELGIGLTAAILIIREFRAYARETQAKKNGNGNGNGGAKAGERSVEEWELRNLKTATEANKPVIDILKQQTELLTQQKDLLQELVFAHRNDPRSKAFRAGV